MKWWREHSTTFKLAIVVIASWVVPPLIWDEEFVGKFIFIVYLGLFGAVIHFVNALQDEAHLEGRRFQIRIMEMDGGVTGSMETRDAGHST